MKNKFLRRFARNQSGLTLIELIVALVLGSVILFGASVTFIQIMKITQESKNHMLALRETQNAGYWVSLDSLKADQVVFVPDPWNLTLTWEAFDGPAYKVEYAIATDGNMTRALYSGPDPDNYVLQSNIRVAHDLVPAETTYSIPAYGVEFTVTATVNDMTETRVYRAVSRLD